METLPSEVVELIANFLSLEDLHRFAKVCKNFNTISDRILKRRNKARVLRLIDKALEYVKENPTKLLLAGSAAVWKHQGCPTDWFPDDVDLFIYNFREGDEITIDGKQIDNFYGSTTFTLETKDGQIQIVLSSLFHTQKDVLDSFDISSCMIGINLNKDFVFGNGYTPPNKAVAWVSSDLPHRVFVRMEKYEKRNFYFSKINHFVTEKQRKFIISYTCCIFYGRPETFFKPLTKLK